MSDDLSGLVILSAEDDQVVIAMRLDPQVVIRDRRYPRRARPELAPRHAPGDHVAGIESELCLEQRGARRCWTRPTRGLWVAINDVVAGQRAAVDLDAERLLAEFLGFAVLVDLGRPVP